ncbi:MAG: type IV pilus modification PilV family protein [Thermodesulfobacteriota bacterium]
MNQKGFSILEILIGFIILAIGLLAIAALQTTSVKGNYFSNNLMQATYIAQDRLEYLKNISYDSLRSGNFPEESIIVRGMTFNRSYNITKISDSNGDYYRIDYTVLWNDGVDHRITFSTIRSY